MTRVFVVDTSYLTEFYSVPKFSEPPFSKALIDRMAQEVSARFHVPVGCLYKLCDHITDVPDGNLQRRLDRRWTRNQALKAYEPDAEPNPLM